MKRRYAKMSLLAVILALTALLPSLPASAASLNSAPVARNMELETYRDIAVTGAFDCLDPEGDQVVYSIDRQPKKGAVEIDGDSFTYTPADGKKGKDSFTYVATDSSGNMSEPATVTVNIKKQETSVTYSDMYGNDARYAATALAEEGVFVGEKLGDGYLFMPDKPVTRGEFLVMCMTLRGGELLDGIVRTGFYDDELIPLWQKPYVTTALTEEVISGSVNGEGKIVFSPDRPITVAEAAVMLNNAMEITDVYVRESSAPAWAAQAVGNLSSCHIIDASAGVSASTLTRADAAKMLVGAMKVKASRSSQLLTWAQ